MSLMEYCTVEDGRIVRNYEALLAPIRCDRCEAPAGTVIDVGDSRPFWICPLCHEETNP